jgi:hypothetical protein
MEVVQDVLLDDQTRPAVSAELTQPEVVVEAIGAQIDLVGQLSGNAIHLGKCFEYAILFTRLGAYEL